MSFSSVSFILFMIAVFLIYWGIPHKFRYILLICANLTFYVSFGLEQLVVLICMITAAYGLALLIEKKEDGPCFSDKLSFCFGIIALVSPLLIYKYLAFTIYAVGKLFSRFLPVIDEHTIKLIAPIGISFYTFELLSYLIDVYKGKIAAERNPFKLFVFASFFANITSGPIERAGSFIPQIDKEKTFSYERTVTGLRLVLLGMVKKICGADVLKQYVDAVFGNIYAYKGPAFMVAIILYTYEIYLDFSGYTDMARGFAYTLGFELSENFKAPYLSNGIKEFFGRWHISLSQWLRDYIYIPLGGSRCSKFRKYINLMITFLVSGIWHGASFTFIVWGLLHGVYQCVADMLGIDTRIKSKTEKDNTEMQNNKSVNPRLLIKCVRIIVTFCLVSFAWMFFRANSLSDAKYIALNMFFGSNFYGQMLQMGFLTASAYVSVIAIIVLTIAHDILSERMDIIEGFAKLKLPVRWICYVVAGVLVVVLRSHVGAGADFIYFSF